MIPEKTFYAIVVALIIVGGVGIGVAYDHAVSVTTQPNSHGNQTTQSTYYPLTIAITTNNQFNSTIGDQPAFFVLKNGELLSSANISLPANKQINLTIINYDDGTAPTAAQYDKVVGTVNSQITIFNNTNVNSTFNGQSINVAGGEKVTIVPNGTVAHTFTILNGSTTVVNIPITPSSITQTSFTLSSGSYSWQCEAACGSGSSGWEGAMSTPGWMAGTVYVSGSVPAPVSQIYYATLVITTENFYNSTVGNQPVFFLLENGTLSSTAVLNFPSNKEIGLTIINYDDGNGSTPAQFSNVTGTTGNQISIVNNTNVNSTEGSGSINVIGGASVSQIPDSNIAHTFTVLSSSNSVVLNIPVVPSSIEFATFTLSSGNYSWQCEAACGSGSSGWEGAMSAPGWMAGTVLASAPAQAPYYAPVATQLLSHFFEIYGLLSSSTGPNLLVHSMFLIHTTVTSLSIGKASVAAQFLNMQSTVHVS